MNKKTITWAVVGIVAVGILYWLYNMKKAADLQKAAEQNVGGGNSISPEIEALIADEILKGYNREEAVQLLTSRGLMTTNNL